MPHDHRGGVGRQAGPAAEVLDLSRRATLPWPGARRGREAEVVADLADDLVHGPFIEIVVEVRTIQPLAKLDMQAIRLGTAFLALDHVLDGAEDALAGGKPLLPGCRRAGFGEFLGKHDAAAHGAGEAFVGGADVGPRQARRLGWPGCGPGFGLFGELAGPTRCRSRSCRAGPGDSTARPPPVGRRQWARRRRGAGQA